MKNLSFSVFFGCYSALDELSKIGLSKVIITCMEWDGEIQDPMLIFNVDFGTITLCLTDKVSAELNKIDTDANRKC